MNKEVGRPTVMTDEVVKKLEEGFIKGLNDVEACIYVGISKQTLYDYCHKHPEFTDRKEMLKDTPKMKAKLNLDESIKNGDKDISKWYLERKSRDEFSLKQEVDLGNKDNKPFDMNFTNLTTEQIRELLKDEDKR